MKKNIIKLVTFMIALLSVVLFTSCEKSENSQLNRPSLTYKKVQGYKHVFANSIENKAVVKAQNGIICFFNVDDNKETYSNAITLIPSDTSDISQISEFLLNKNLSFDYELDHMLVQSENSSLIFVVENEAGMNFAKEYSGKIDVMHLIQMSFMKRSNFNIKDANRNTSVNDFIENVVSGLKEAPGGGGSNSDCTSGGPGSTSCSVGDIWSSCSVSCSVGYYACCKGSNNTCECIKVSAGTN
ncbi:MAG: hypothetical protein H0S84_09235 [Bacteroidales bacterium]|jgi:hypothetical protein|nr:hypothetical protein [Bacteroidales bacterium]